MFFNKASLVALFAATASSLVASTPLSPRDQSSGTATYYDAGLGACGWTNSNSDYIVAVNSAQYSGGNCGKQIWVWNSATERIAFPTVADECPTCSSGDLDMSEGLFEFLSDGNMDEGVFSMIWGYL